MLIPWTTKLLYGARADPAFARHGRAGRLVSLRPPTQSLAGLLWAPLLQLSELWLPRSPHRMGAHSVGGPGGRADSQVAPRWTGLSGRGRKACWPCLRLRPRLVVWRRWAQSGDLPQACAASQRPSAPILVAAEVELAVGWSGGAQGDLTSLRPIFADAEWWWRVAAGARPHIYCLESSCCRRR